MRSRMILVAVFIGICAFMATGQQKINKCRPEPGGLEAVEPSPLVHSSQFEGLGGFPARGGDVDLGLALSGGGIRSGSFNIGVLKALFDEGILDDVDAISSVSGGGFASYWLYGMHEPTSSERFGESSLGDDRFLENTCRLKSESDMYSFPKMIRALFLPRRKAFADYRANIHRTFGRREPALCSRKIDAYSEAIKESRLPYLFVNTSLDTGELIGLANVIEMTPDHVGNAFLGYSRWSQSGSSIGFLTSIAASGAGIRWKLKRSVANFAPFVINNTKLEKKSIDVFDGGGRVGGGGGENLAALALIKRSVKNIVIVDAGHDPKYRYADFRYLQHLLKGLNIDLCISEGEECASPGILPSKFETGILKGFARDMGSGVVRSRIYYVKMSRPEAIFPQSEIDEIKEKPNASARNTWIEERYAYGFRAAKQVVELIREGNRGSNVTCSNARKHPLDPRMYDYLVKSYGYYLDNSRWRKAKYFGEFFTYRFPHISTIDQSFYGDQLEAFIGLGFKQGKLLAKELENRNSNK